MSKTYINISINKLCRGTITMPTSLEYLREEVALKSVAREKDRRLMTFEKLQQDIQKTF